MSTKYKYYIGATEVTPLGNWKLKATKKKDYIFYRWEFAGKLKFMKADYDLIKSYNYGDEIPFTVSCNAKGGNADPFEWQGYFKYPVDFFFDDDKCTCEAEPHVDDIYRCIIESEDIELIYIPFNPTSATVRIYDNPRTPLLLDTVFNCMELQWVFSDIITRYKRNLTSLLSDDYQVGIDCDVHSPFNIVSSFFNNDDYEDGTSPGADNYVTTVTNKLAANNDYHLFVQLSCKVATDLGAAGDSCELPKYSFKQFFEWLYNMFQVRWYFDSNDDFRIEHVYFFEQGFPNSDFGENGLDFTTLTNWMSKLPYAANHNKYEYILQDLVTNEILKIGRSINYDFLGRKIRYNEDFVDMLGGSKKEKKYNVSDINTNVQDMLNYPDEYYMSNLVMFHCKYEDLGAGNQYIVQLETGALSAALQQNGHLSVANLQEIYWKHDRPLINGYLNGTWQTFDSTKRVKKQEKFTVPLCCATGFDPMAYHKTDLGWGQVQEATIGSDGSLEITLLHESDLIPEEF